MENKDSARTKRIKETPIDDDFLGIKKGVKFGATKLSEGLDRIGFTGDNKKEEPVKKAEGGMISSASKRADGCAIRGKTRGKMV